MGNDFNTKADFKKKLSDYLRFKNSSVCVRCKTAFERQLLIEYKHKKYCRNCLQMILPDVSQISPELINDEKKQGRLKKKLLHVNFWLHLLVVVFAAPYLWRVQVIDEGDLWKLLAVLNVPVLFYCLDNFFPKNRERRQKEVVSELSKTLLLVPLRGRLFNRVDSEYYLPFGITAIVFCLEYVAVTLIYYKLYIPNT